MSDSDSVVNDFPLESIAALDQEHLGKLRPGHLANVDAPQLALHTHIGQMLFLGRRMTLRKHEIVGVIRFASQMRLMWDAISHDDPYADWWLIKIEKSLKSAKRQITGSHAQLLKRFTSLDELDWPTVSSSKPLQVPLAFSNPYGYQGAYLVLEVDKLARTVISARHFGLIPNRELVRLLAMAGRCVRRAFMPTMQYKSIGVTRDDIRRQTRLAVAAKDLMGKVPEDVLDGRSKASLIVSAS